MRLARAEIYQRWRDHFEAQSRSGLTVFAYCEKHDVSPSMFLKWRERLMPKIAAPHGLLPTAQAPGEVGAASAFVRLAVSRGTAVDPSARVRVVLPGGVEVLCPDLPSTSWIAQLVGDLSAANTVSRGASS